MKNVAGYDVSRLLAGSLGTLGLIVEASFKVLPQPRAEATRRMRMTEERALETLNRWAGQPLPLTASAWHDGDLTVRLSGADTAVRAAGASIGGEEAPAGQVAPFWRDVREQTHAFFAGPEPLWRIAVPSVAPALRLPGRQLIEWGGGLRWLKSDAEAQVVREAAQRARGHATLFRAERRVGEAFSALDAVQMRLHRELKATFDPAGIFNPGRLYASL
jgi:glycolate oxidase FAD binding subunit